MSEWRYDENTNSFRQYNNSPKKNDDGGLLGWGLIIFFFAIGL